MLTRLGGVAGVAFLVVLAVVATSGRWEPVAALAAVLLVVAVVQARRRGTVQALRTLLAPAGGGFWSGRVVGRPAGLLGAGRAPGRWLWAGVPADLVATSEHVALSVHPAARRLAGYAGSALTWADVVAASDENEGGTRPRGTTSTYVTLVLVPTPDDPRPRVLTFLTDDAGGLVDAVRRSATGTLAPPPRP